VRTDRTDCECCQRRVILALGVPPLDWDPDPAGTFAARHAASGAWHARPYLPGLVLAPLEKRRRVHRCETP
jgi:hypothetical protein